LTDLFFLALNLLKSYLPRHRIPL